MYVLAITGGLGSGKSTASHRLAARGAYVIALDDVARSVLAEDADVLRQVIERFGDSVVGADGKLDRSSLAAAAFGRTDAAHALNSIVHPAAIRATRRLLAELAAAPVPPAIVVLEVPLLAETPELLESADEVLAIAAPVESRVRRAVARGMAEADARRRIACQATDAERAAVSDTVIQNDGERRDFEAALDRYYDERIAPRLGRS